MNFSLSFVRNGACALLLAAIFGCGSDDGQKDFDLGRAAYEVRDLKKAERLLEKSVGQKPGDADRQLLLARVKLDLGELAAAQAHVAKAAELAGGDVDVLLLGAQIAWHAKDYAAAVSGFTAVANNEKLAPELRAQGFVGLGIVEMTCENPDFARIAFLQALRLHRRSAAAWYHLGLLYRDGFGYVEAALEQFEVFVRLEAAADPRVQKVQRTIIPALKETISQAATDRPGVAKRDSAASAAAIAKAEAAWKKKTYKTARQCYQQALDADPLSYPAALGLAKAWLETDKTKSGQTKAFENYRLACTLRPSAISTFLTAGSLASKLGLANQAVEIYSRAVAASPTSPDALDGLIRALRRVGNRAKVAQAYQAYRTSLTKTRKP